MVIGPVIVLLETTIEPPATADDVAGKIVT